MKVQSEAKVYLVGAQSFIRENVSRFLDDEGITKFDFSTSNDSLNIPEMAGRLCFMSFNNPRPGGNTSYIKHIKEVGHGSVLEHTVYNFVITGVSRSLSHELVRHRAGWSYCLAGETLVYSERMCNGKRAGPTKRTIRSICEMAKTPHGRSRLKLMKLRCLDGEVFTTTRIKAVSESGVKDLYRITLADGKSVRCSIDHRFLTPDGWKPLSEIDIGQPLATNGLPSKGIKKDQLFQMYHVQNKMITEIAKDLGCSPHTVRKWVGIYGLAKQKGKGMTGRRPWNDGLTYTTGYQHSEETKKKLSAQKRGPKNHHWQGDNATAQAGRYRAQKMFPTMPCEACGKSEGHRHHRDRNTLNNTKENIQFLCGSCHTRLHLEEDGPTNILKVRWSAVVSIERDGREMTYDIEVEHPEHNFIANGFVTHNSQLSQRYVDESVAEYTVPEIIEADEELNAIWTQAVEASHKAYCELATRLSDKLKDPSTAANAMLPPNATGTDIRKAARQAARSVLPNATETKIFVTTNARSLRHFLEMRGSRHADPEIRKLANQIHTILVAHSPVLFDDYIRTELPDGTFELTTPYPKV